MDPYSPRPLVRDTSRPRILVRLQKVGGNVKSTAGRPRMLTDAQVAEIKELFRTRITRRLLAKKFGVSFGLIVKVLKKSHEYKQCSPELRA